MDPLELLGGSWCLLPAKKLTFYQMCGKFLSKTSCGEKSSTVPEKNFFSQTVPYSRLWALKPEHLSLFFTTQLGQDNNMVHIHDKHHPKQHYIVVLGGFPLQSQFSSKARKAGGYGQHPRVWSAAHPSRSWRSWQKGHVPLKDIVKPQF